MWHQVTRLEDAYAGSCMDKDSRCNNSVRFQLASAGRTRAAFARPDSSTGANDSLLPPEAKDSVCCTGNDEVQMIFET